MRVGGIGPAAQVAVLALLLAGACAHQTPARAEVERGRQELRQDEYFAALAAGDAERVARLHAEDAVLHIANMPPIQGREAIRRFYQTMFGFLTASEITPESTRISSDGEMAWSAGRTSNEFRGPDGPMRYAGKFLLVWERRQGEWMVVFYGISGNEPTPGR
jgi:uncharacterized protein (TIGR02246 family)